MSEWGTTGQRASQATVDSRLLELVLQRSNAQAADLERQFRNVRITRGRARSSPERWGDSTWLRHFIGWLPPRVVLAAAAETDGPGGDTGATGKLSVLVVDDNRDAAETLSLLLELSGHEARAVHDGPAALALLETYTPDVILLDIGLPGMNGFEVARRVRERREWQRIRLIALTGYGLEEHRQQAREAGFDQHLTKPVDLPELERALHGR